MVCGGTAVAVAAIVGQESEAGSTARLLADSISLLGHKANAGGFRRHVNLLDAAFSEQAAFEPLTLHQISVRSELVSGWES
jgi:hypothetical protein